MIQDTLFAHQLARRDDPQTSKAAACKVIASGKVSAMHTRVLNALVEHGPSTSAELAAKSGLDRYDVARRLPELERKSMVTRGNARACKVTGNAAAVWGAA